MSGSDVASKKTERSSGVGVVVQHQVDAPAPAAAAATTTLTTVPSKRKRAYNENTSSEARRDNASDAGKRAASAAFHSAHLNDIDFEDITALPDVSADVANDAGDNGDGDGDGDDDEEEEEEEEEEVEMILK